MADAGDHCFVCSKAVVVGGEELLMWSFGDGRGVEVKMRCPGCGPSSPLPIVFGCCQCQQPVAARSAVQSGCDFINLKIKVARFYCSSACAAAYDEEALKNPEMQMTPRCMNCGSMTGAVEKCPKCECLYYCSDCSGAREKHKDICCL